MRPDRGLPAPDLVIYLDVPIEKTQQRGNFGVCCLLSLSFYRSIYLSLYLYIYARDILF